MTGHMLIFGMGYTANRLADQLRVQGWQVTGTQRQAGTGTIAFDDQDGVRKAMGQATHILSSVPPSDADGDPVLLKYGGVLASAPAQWLGYLSSTGVYGDTGGAWVDESAATGSGRRSARAEADRSWQALRGDVRVFRLPGIYGPGRSALERVLKGKAHRIAAGPQVFSRVHVDDIVAAVIAGLTGSAGAYNIADDRPCSQNAVIELACDMLGIAWPALQDLDAAQLSPMARGFYAESRRVSNRKAKRILGWKPVYSDFRAGLLACMANTSPMTTNTAPDTANNDQL